LKTLLYPSEPVEVGKEVKVEVAGGKVEGEEGRTETDEEEF